MGLLSFYRNSFSGLSREVWVLSISVLINRAGMMVLPFLTIYSTRGLGFSIVEAGIVTGCYGAGSLCGSLLGGELTDRIGYYKVMVWSLLASAIGLASLPLFTSFVPLCLAVFLTSTLGDAFRPATMAAVGTYSKPENMTRSISLLRMALNLGISIGPAIGGLFAGWLGYHWLFILDGFTCLLAVLFLVCFLTRKEAPTEGKDDEIPAQVTSVYSDHIYLIFLVVTAVNIVAFMQILSTVPLYLKQEMAMTEQQIGLFFTLNGLLVFLFEMPLVSLSEKRWHPFQSMILGAVCIAVGNICLNLDAHWILILVGYNVMISFGEIINFPFGNSLALGRATKEQRGKYMGLWAMMFSVTFIVAPILGTWLVDQFGFSFTWWVMAGLSLISIPGFIWLRKNWSISLPSAS